MPWMQAIDPLQLYVSIAVVVEPRHTSVCSVHLWHVDEVH
jgi:hypothetical protein